VPILSYDEYVATLGRLTQHIDPTTPTAKADLQAQAQFKKLI